MSAPSGSPDGEGGPKSAERVLGELRDLIAAGGGLVDPAYEHRAQAAAAVLFDPAAVGPEAEAAQVHVQLSSIAADAGRWIETTAGGRAAVAAEHPWDVKVHDEFLAAIGRGPEAYKAWCAQEGATLLRAFTDARRKALETR